MSEDVPMALVEKAFYMLRLFGFEQHMKVCPCTHNVEVLSPFKMTPEGIEFFRKRLSENPCTGMTPHVVSNAELEYFLNYQIAKARMRIRRAGHGEVYTHEEAQALGIKNVPIARRRDANLRF